LIIGQHHGDEVLGVELAVAFARELCEKAQERRYKAILGQYQFWIIPTINPEGFRSVTSGEFAWKRKNNTDSNKNGKFDLRTDGVDLNRKLSGLLGK
jgi:predicted deacylase